MSIQWRRGLIPYLPVKAEIGHYVLLLYGVACLILIIFSCKLLL